MMKIQLLTTILFFSLIVHAQDTIYFDKDWQPTTKGNHSFYRPLPLKKLGSLFLLRDYYKNGQLQMQGYLSDANNENSYVGDLFWYEENGLDSSESHYYNRTSTKELIYYAADGSIWKKISYDKNGEIKKIEVFWKNQPLFLGNVVNTMKFSGVFAKKVPDDFYNQNPIDQDNEPEKIATTYSPVPPPMNPNKADKKKYELKEQYRIVMYWENGKKAEETIFGLDGYGYSKRIKKTVWDKNGNLLFTIDFEKDIQPRRYSVFNYFTKNDFVLGVKEEEIYESGNLVEKKVYSVKGELILIEKYQDGVLLEKRYPIENKISLYRNGEPFDGYFEETIGNNLQIYQLKNGIKIDKEIVKNPKTGQLIYEGIYQNGKPWNGQFFSTIAESYELSNFKNGKREGIQKIFENYYDDLKEEFEMKDGMKEGFRKQYNNGDLMTQSFYKNDKIYEGEIEDSDRKEIYKKGALVQKIFFQDIYSKRPILIKQYKDNQISTVDYYNFTIKDNFEDVYTGKFKNQQPYEGYFLNDTIMREFPVVNFYEKGQMKYQYSFDFLEQMDSYEHYLYNVKTDFVNGKINNGMLYKMIGDRVLLRENYSSGKVVNFDLNLFAMHYFNRVSFKSEKDEIMVSEMQSPYRIKSKQNKKGLYDFRLYKENELIFEGAKPMETKEGAPGTMTLYYIRENQLQKYSFKPNRIDHNIDADLMLKLIYLFPIKANNSTEAISFLLHKMDQFIANQIEGSEDVMLEFPFKEEDILTFVYYDENGKLSEGIKLTESADKSIEADVYEKGKKIKTKKLNSMKQLIENDREVLRSLMNDVKF